MKDLNVVSNEHGLVRVFAIDLPDADVAKFVKTPETLATSLGVRQLDLTYVDLIDISALGEIGLHGYLQEGIDIAPDALAEVRPDLDHLKGHVAVILSKAFAGHAVDAVLQAPLRLVAILPEARPDHNAGDLSFVDTPSPVPAKKPKSQAAISGMVATYVLLGFFIFTGLLVLFAG